MTKEELGLELNNLYTNAKNGEKVLMIHVFGVKYADEIKSSKYLVKDIIKSANINESYVTELNKGIKLAKYVKIKE